MRYVPQTLLLLLLLTSSLKVHSTLGQEQYQSASVSISPAYQEVGAGSTTTLSIVGQSTIGGLVFANIPASLSLVGEPMCNSGCRVPFVTDQIDGTKIEFNIDGEIATASFTVAVSPSAPVGTVLNVNAYLVGGPDAVEMSSAMIAVVDVSPIPTPAQAQQSSGEGLDGPPSIRITKKVCDNTSFPVFVESHCHDDVSASFHIETPNLQHATTVQSGSQFQPPADQLAQGDMWRIIDANESSYAPVTVLSCLEHRPGEALMLGVAQVGNLRGLPRWDVWWTPANTGAGERYTPSLECIWFELPKLAELPAVLSLQAFTSSEPYLSWTDAERIDLGAFPRGASGEDLEANMVMTNQSTGEVYSFAADAYGQVLVPAGTYTLQSVDTGNQDILSMYLGSTVLAEIGLGGFASDPSSPANTGAAPDIAGWAAIVRYCDANGCLPVVDATIYYESLDGSTSGYCVTEAMDTPGGRAGVCGFEFVWGVPIRLTLDTSTLPPGMVLVSENPVEYLVQENLGGDPAVPIFDLGPA